MLGFWRQRSFPYYIIILVSSPCVVSRTWSAPSLHSPCVAGRGVSVSPPLSTPLSQT